MEVMDSLLHTDTTSNAKKFGDESDLVRGLHFYAEFA
jgi:hypothetical protein